MDSEVHKLIRTQTLSMISAALLMLLSMASFAAQEVKKPEEAFLYDAYGEESWIVVDWDIEDGYYLYRDKMSFAVDDPAITLGEPELPPGEIYEDEFFGEQAIYRGEQQIIIPILNKPLMQDRKFAAI